MGTKNLSSTSVTNMKGIFVKGMKMPVHCRVCPFLHDTDICPGWNGCALIDCDIQEAKRDASWIRYNNPLYSPFDNTLPWVFKCENCGEANERETKYCPNCGAKMEVTNGKKSTL